MTNDWKNKKKTRPRLKSFDEDLAVNRLITAADPLLTLAVMLPEQKTPPASIHFYPSLTNATQAFEGKASASGYSSTIILAARYLIFAFIKETIHQTTWGNRNEWKNFPLFTVPKKGGPNASEYFFTILERSAESPTIYLDLLELGYLCLSLGYEGKYHNKPTELRQFINKLYNCIRDERGDFSKQLFINSPSITLLPPAPSSRFSRLAILGIITFVFVLAGIYFSYDFYLNKTIASVMQSLEK